MSVTVGVKEGRGVIVFASVEVCVMVGVWVRVDVGRNVSVADGVGEEVFPWQDARVRPEHIRMKIPVSRKRLVLIDLRSMEDPVWVIQAGRVMTAAPYPTTEERSPVLEPEVS